MLVLVCLGSLPVKEGGRELVHCTLSQLKKIFFLYYSFLEVCVCAIWYRVLIQYINLSEAIVHMLHCTSSFFQFQFSFAGRQGSSQSDPCTITGFGSFKLPTCDWLQKGRSHSHMESSLVWWLREMLHVGLRVN